MILRGSTKVVPFMEAIEATIARSDRHRFTTDVLTYTHLIRNPEGVIYLGSGHWRAAPIWEDPMRGPQPMMFGVRLINPDRTADEIAAVERGIAILCHFEYTV